MAYLIAWLIYLTAAALLMAGFERYLAGLIRQRQLRIFCRSLVAIVLFTPGVAYGDQHYYMVPACIEVLFNVLAHSRDGMLKAALPILLVTAVVFAGLFVYEARDPRKKEAAGEREEPSL